MRWMIKVAKKGDIRTKAGFLFLPKTINLETRWLEYAEWQEEYYSGSHDSWWFATKWMDK